LHAFIGVSCDIVTVNRNIVIMTSWLPHLAGDRPRYIAIADAIADALASGKLTNGDRLPPQRELAWRLGVTVGTVTRGYQEAERRGLLSGEVGRGSYLRDPAQRRVGLPSIAGEEPGVLNMQVAAPPRVQTSEDLDAALDELKATAGRLSLLEYGPSVGALAYRQMGSAWLNKCNVDVEPNRVVVTAGAHAALIACLSMITRPQDHLLAECLTYPTILPIARALGLQLNAVEMDQHGVIPASLEAALRHCEARVLYLVPTLHNPTTVTLSAERREEIAAIARRHDITVIEDDIFCLLAEEQLPTIFSFAPERTYYITSLSKTLAPGLRMGFVATPPGLAENLGLQQMIMGARIVGLAAEVARSWIAGGTADRHLRDIRTELALRRRISLDVLGKHNPSCTPGSIFLWLPLPDHWRGSEFVGAAQAQGLKVTPGSAFAVGRRVNDQAIRVCFGLVETRDALKDGLKRLEHLLGETPGQNFRALA
jgi:DNA-binding transcriptional MocR family regulator